MDIRRNEARKVSRDVSGQTKQAVNRTNQKAQKEVNPTIHDRILVAMVGHCLLILPGGVWATEMQIGG